MKSVHSTRTRHFATIVQRQGLRVHVKSAQRRRVTIHIGFNSNRSPRFYRRKKRRQPRKNNLVLAASLSPSCMHCKTWVLLDSIQYMSICISASFHKSCRCPWRSIIVTRASSLYKFVYDEVYLLLAFIASSIPLSATIFMILNWSATPRRVFCTSLFPAKKPNSAYSNSCSFANSLTR